MLRITRGMGGVTPFGGSLDTSNLTGTKVKNDLSLHRLPFPWSLRRMTTYTVNYARNGGSPLSCPLQPDTGFWRMLSSILGCPLSLLSLTLSSDPLSGGRAIVR